MIAGGDGRCRREVSHYAQRALHLQDLDPTKMSMIAIEA
jgi:predicted membrane-bound spermidine synthase